jgi:hypothetical protein
LKRQAYFTSNVKKLFLEAISKLQLQSKGNEISKLQLQGNGDDAVLNTCIYTLLLDAYQNLTGGLGACFVEELVPCYTQKKQNSNFPQADVMHAMMKVLGFPALCLCMTRAPGVLCR